MHIANKLLISAACQIFRFCFTDYANCATFFFRKTLLCSVTVLFTVWKTANKTSQNIIQARLKKIVRIILSGNLFTPNLQVYRELFMLKLNDIYLLKLPSSCFVSVIANCQKALTTLL